jgi:hypothetical protein
MEETYQKMERLASGLELSLYDKPRLGTAEDVELTKMSSFLIGNRQTHAAIKFLAIVKASAALD